MDVLNVAVLEEGQVVCDGILMLLLVLFMNRKDRLNQELCNPSPPTPPPLDSPLKSIQQISFKYLSRYLNITNDRAKE